MILYGLKKAVMKKVLDIKKREKFLPLFIEDLFDLLDHDLTDLSHILAFHFQIVNTLRH